MVWPNVTFWMMVFGDLEGFMVISVNMIRKPCKTKIFFWDGIIMVIKSGVFFVGKRIHYHK